MLRTNAETHSILRFRVNSYHFSRLLQGYSVEVRRCKKKRKAERPTPRSDSEWSKIPLSQLLFIYREQSPHSHPDSDSDIQLAQLHSQEVTFCV